MERVKKGGTYCKPIKLQVSRAMRKDSVEPLMCGSPTHCADWDAMMLPPTLQFCRPAPVVLHPMPVAFLTAGWLYPVLLLLLLARVTPASVVSSLRSLC